MRNGVVGPPAVDAAVGGSWVASRSGAWGLASEDWLRDASWDAWVESARTSLCRSSASSSLSSPSVSNASASVELTARDARSRDDALEWKDGGGEFGIGCDCLGGAELGLLKSSSSWAFTWTHNQVSHTIKRQRPTAAGQHIPAHNVQPSCRISCWFAVLKPKDSGIPPFATEDETASVCR